MKTPLDQITISTNLGNRRFVNELRRHQEKQLENIRRHQETNQEINFSRLCIGLMRDGWKYRKRQEKGWSV